MPRSIESQLNESLRDTLVAYYLGEIVPNSPMLRRLGLDSRLKTANDLYEFFLLDNQVSNDVETSPVASAIASLQQFINGTLMGMEPGYDGLRPDEARFVEWRDRSSQYPIWAANMQLALYPEVYISPDLRLKKSAYFTQLENDINQNKIHIDTTQEAVKSYLASFEEVANLTVINGYIDSDRFAEGNYYFVGKSRAEQVYYWRTVDMNERAYQEGTDGPKDDYPTPGAWSDWKKADIGVTANTLERTIRPVYFNNRLFMTWVDLIHVVPDIELIAPTKRARSTDELLRPDWPAWLQEEPVPPEIIKTPQVQLLFNISYKKYDDSWSAPQTYMDVTTANTFVLANKEMTLDKELNSIAVFDVSSSPESLFIAMYAGEQPGRNEVDGTQTKYIFLATAYIDKNFNTTVSFPEGYNVDAPYNSSSAEPNELRVRNTCWTFSINNNNNFQFTWSPLQTIAILNIETTSPTDINYNYQNAQESIMNIRTDSNTPTIDHERSTLNFKTGITHDLINGTHYSYDLHFVSTQFGISINLHLTPKNNPPFTETYVPLGESSYITISSLDQRAGMLGFGIFGSGLYPIYASIIDNEEAPYLTLPGNWNLDTPYSLESKIIKTDVLNLFMHNSNTLYPLCTTAVTIDGSATGYPTPLTVTDATETETFKLRQVFCLPRDMNAPTEPVQTYSQSALADQLTPPSLFAANLLFNKEDLSLLTSHTPHNEVRTRYFLLHGIYFYSSEDIFLGKAIKQTQFELHFQAAVEASKIAPKVNTRTDPALGIAEYIDFSTSSIKFSDGPSTVKRAPIRMNTLFARELINKASIALEALLSWDTQHLPEPPIGEETEPTVMDFKGANGLYFWELFLHLPFMVSHRLNLEQQFSDAEFWLAFIFDPARKANGAAPAYWNVRPLVEVSDPDYFMRAPIDPDGIAASDPVRYQKAVYFHYIKNLIDRGDMAYRQLTPDSLGEAKLWYVRILDLLGPRPDTTLVSQWSPATLHTLTGSTNLALREFAAKLEQQEQQVRTSAKTNGGKALISFKEAPLRLSTFGSDPTLNEEDNAFFITPMNSELVKHWDALESRLYNLRNNLTLDGKPLSLPLFAAPLDPRALLAAYANGASGGGASSLLAQEIPHYRYTMMFARASGAVETLVQFGATLLSIIERREQAEFMELQQQQAWEFARFAIDLQVQAQLVEVEAKKALEASKAIADARNRFYSGLADENVSVMEAVAAGLLLKARLWEGVAATATATAARLKLIPNHAGVEVETEVGMTAGVGAGAQAGGQRLEGVAETLAAIGHGAATLHNAVGGALDRTEHFRRRREEWENARDQAALESEHITAQLAVHDAQTQITALQLRQAIEAKAHAEIQYAFLKKRFTNSQLYSWLNGQFSTFYYQAYDATLSLCLATQACWQYEIADYSTHFIQPSAWKDTYRGLAAGESLKLNLLRMDAAYLARNERKLEIVKTVSVRQLPASSVESPSINPGWVEVVERLTTEGVAEFEITQAMLDADYPGHYLRRIKRISVSLPVTVGPYQDIRATLTQTYNAVQMTGPAGGPLKENMRASQQIAVSTGVDDDGLFVFNFDDERYLPFEGTGAISRWTLSFPNPEAQRDMIDSITDIIVHLRYTARSGGVR